MLTVYRAVQGLVVLVAAIDAAKHRFSREQREERTRRRAEYWRMREEQRVSRDGETENETAVRLHFLW